MAKIKKISINAFDEIVKNTYIPTETVIWQDVEIIIKKTLSFKEMMTFVDSATKSCFTSDNCTYIPEVKDFAIKSCVVEMYTNISLPQNVEHKYNLIYCSDIIQTVLQHVNIQQFNEIVQAINDKIDHLSQASVEMVHKQMNDLYMAFDKIQSQISDTFSVIGSDDVLKLLGAITDGKFDEAKLVDAYISQKSDSSKSEDAHLGGDN